MAVESETVRKGRRDFPAFPFDPYPIQIDFMNALYDSLDKGGVAMLESPTGTGKTLSIICSALQWLVDQKRKPKPCNAARGGGGGGGGGEVEEPDWMRDFCVEEEQRRVASRKVTRRVPDRKISACSSIRSSGNCRGLKNVGGNSSGTESGFDEEVEFLVEDYDSEEEGMGKRKGGGSSGWSSSEDERLEEDEEMEVVPKVFFCSRTHSQLSQFVKEFKRTAFASEISLVCLGSRKTMCINPEVSKLGSSSLINERCLELQKKKEQKASKVKVQSDGGRTKRSKSSSGCPMLKKHTLQKQFKDEVWQEAMDIEDLVHLGSKIGTCPYYGSRSTIPIAELVVLPYQSLFLKSARESLSLNLNNSVVIIDEAHNLADSLTSMYNSQITLSQLKQVYSHLECYLSRFLGCLGASNRRYIQTLMALTQSFCRMLLEDRDSANSVGTCNAQKAFEKQAVDVLSMTINDFLFSLDIDNINLVKLLRYIKESNIIHKVCGYASKLASCEGGPLHINDENHSLEGTAISGFQSLADILLSLTNNDVDGRMIISRQKWTTCPTQLENGYLKFIMLSGEKIFSEIMDEVHAVVLAGGTLQPIEETRMRLFPSLTPERMHFFSCNHVVPPESILPIIVSRGPSGVSFDFSYNSRATSHMMEELGHLLCNLVTVVPEGIVVFFSSFEYEGQVYEAWKASGILDRILKKKHLFREPRSNIGVEQILKEYKESIQCCIENPRDNLGPSGALLLAVVGGKVSEGINFGDGMGRCVVMVGLPYPSPSDVELMERIKHIERLGEPISPEPNKPLSNTFCANNAIQSGFGVLRSCKQRGKEYYENLCMKAVNQSIGRAIRHINDYAAILLVDSRYASNLSKASFSHPTSKLPVWIKDRLISANGSYGQVHRLLHQFFQFNKQRGCG